MIYWTSLISPPAWSNGACLYLSRRHEELPTQQMQSVGQIFTPSLPMDSSSLFTVNAAESTALIIKPDIAAGTREHVPSNCLNVSPF